jgi:hypothetical protein
VATTDTRALRPSVRDRTHRCCEYCLLPEEADFTHHEVDHIVAEQHGGKTTLENLAYACFDWNKYKGPNIASIDPDSGERTWLFNPRTQQWGEHFLLDKDGIIIGLTTEGRATARLLHINDPERVRDRVGLLAIGKLLLMQRQ